MIAGRCPYHYKVFRIKACKERNELRSKNSINNQIKKYHSQKKDKSIENLVSWYEERLKEFTGNCAECGKEINRKYCYASVAHVLPKKPGIGGFPSVAKHSENAIELGATCGCHNKYDRNWESASKMKIFPLAIEKFKKIEPFIAEEERKYIPEVFLKYVP